MAELSQQTLAIGNLDTTHNNFATFSNKTKNIFQKKDILYARHLPALAGR